MRILIRVLLTVVLWFPGTVAAETVPSRGAALAQTCVTCHGPDGHSQDRQLDVLDRQVQDLAPVVRDPLPGGGRGCDEGHEMISLEIRSSVRIPRYSWPSVTTTATCVREVTIESRASRRELEAVT